MKIVPSSCFKASSRTSLEAMSKWLVGSSKIKRFACFNNISVSTTRPFSPPESKEISL